MAQETGTESQIPEGCRWGDLVVKDGIEQMNFYRATLLELGSSSLPRVQAIFVNAQTAASFFFRQKRTTKAFLLRLICLVALESRQ